MFTTYIEAREWIESRLKFGIKPGLTRMKEMMARLGSPESDIMSIHIGGTNGKGSTVTFLRSILQEAGYKVGTFTSPYIEHFNERISVDGVPINNRDFIEAANAVRAAAEDVEESGYGDVTEFEVITAMSFYYFAKIHRVDIVLYEVGLGGRLDSTNIIEPAASVVTNIGLDHTHILGATHKEIAYEKAGIIKEQTPVFTAVKHPEALKVIEAKASDCQAPLYRLGVEFSTHHPQSLPRGERFDFQLSGTEWKGLEISMLGRHQIDNASLAAAVSIVLSEQGILAVGEGHIRRGLNKAFWPGRMEVISENPIVILDGAHNEEGVEALAKEIKSRYGHLDAHMVFAALKDKNVEKMISRLDEIANKLTFVSFDMPRAADAKDLLAHSHSTRKLAVDDWKEYLSEEIPRLKQNELLVITGSLYFISEVKGYLHQFAKDKKIHL